MKEQIKEILEEYACEMVRLQFNGMYNDEEEIDKVVELILKLL